MPITRTHTGRVTVPGYSRTQYEAPVAARQLKSPIYMKSLIAGRQAIGPRCRGRRSCALPRGARTPAEMWQTLLAIVARPSHGGRHIGAPGVVEQQPRSPPGLAHDREVVDISDRREKIPRALLLLFIRNRWSRGRAQAHCLLLSPQSFYIPAWPHIG